MLAVDYRVASGLNHRLWCSCSEDELRERFFPPGVNQTSGAYSVLLVWLCFWIGSTKVAFNKITPELPPELDTDRGILTYVRVMTSGDFTYDYLLLVFLPREGMYVLHLPRDQYELPADVE